MERAAKLVADRGRAYLVKRKARRVPQVQLFSKNLVELDLLCLVFGGNHYHHLSGRTWMLQRKVDVRRLAEIVRPFLQEGHHLQDLYQPPQTPNEPSSAVAEPHEQYSVRDKHSLG